MAKADRRLFRPFDLIFPLLPVALMTALCIYAGVISEGSRRWVSLTTGLTILALGTWGWYFARYAFTYADYVTRHGLYVVLGKLNRPSIQEVEEYTESCINFWSTRILQKQQAVVINRLDVLDAIRNVRCFFIDKKFVGFGYRLIRGIPKRVKFLGVARNDIQILISYWPEVPKHGVPGIFRHELSHIILSLNGFDPGNNHGANHHQIFSQVGLGV